jgi:hypothetical protein
MGIEANASAKKFAAVLDLVRRTHEFQMVSAYLQIKNYPNYLFLFILF